MIKNITHYSAAGLSDQFHKHVWEVNVVSMLTYPLSTVLNDTGPTE